MNIVIPKSKLTLSAICFLLTCHLSGCVGALVRDTNPKQQALLDTPVKDIETVQLEDLSTSDPVTVDEAAETYLKEVMAWQSQEKPADLSLEDVRAAALEHNLDLKAQVYEPSLAQESLNVERAKFETLFVGGIQYQQSNTPTASQLESSESTAASFSVGLLQPLPTGGTASLTVPAGRFETDNDFSLLNPAFDTDLRFSLSQPLLRGAGVATNTHSIRVARFQKKIADARTKLEAIRILALADQAYWLVYGASRELEIRQQQYDLAMRQLNEAKTRVRAGYSPRIEITRAESGVAARLEGIINAVNQARLYQRDLKRILSRPDLPIGGNTPLNLTTLPTPLGLALEPQAIADQAVGNRMEMLELELQLVMDESTIDFARNARLPLFTLDYVYNINGLGSSFGKAYSQAFEADFADWSVGLNAQIPIGNQAARARFGYAVLQRAQRLATKDLRKQSIEEEVYDSIDRLNQNWQRILAARQEVLFSARTYEAERRQFELSVRTSTDVLDAAARLAEAQSREIHALVAYQVAQVDIAYATGTLLGHGNVVWDPNELL